MLHISGSDKSSLETKDLLAMSVDDWRILPMRNNVCISPWILSHRLHSVHVELLCTAAIITERWPSWIVDIIKRYTRSAKCNLHL